MTDLKGHVGDEPSAPFVFIPADQPPRSRNKMLSSVVVPRPIAMISTVGEDGIFNVAPYSYYQPITWQPMLIGVSMGLRGADRRRDTADTGLKDSYLNAVSTGDFVVNVTTDAFRGQIEHAATEYPHGMSEFDAVPWTAIESRLVTAPSIAEAPARIECTVHKVFDLGEAEGSVKYLVGEVQCIVADRRVVLEETWLDDLALAPIGRLGGRAFVRAIPDAVYEEERVRYEPGATVG